MKRTMPQAGLTSGAGLIRGLALSLAVISLVLVSNNINGIEAIVKQTQPSQQSRSDDPSLSLSSSSSLNNYNNVNQQAPSSAQQQQQPSSGNYAPSQSISSASSASISSPPSAQGASPMPAQQIARSTNNNQMDMMNSNQNQNQNVYQPSAGQKYADNMAAAASNPEQSYQAAAQSVNMALANSGIYNTGYQPGSAGPSSSSSSSSSSGNMNGPSAGQQPSGGALNPLHYFYYPARDTSSQQGASSPGGQSSSSSGSPSGSQSMATYADQLSSALSSMGGSSPEAAASNQDPSYLPQPMDSNSNNQNNPLSMYGPQPGNNNNQQQQPQPQYNDMNSFNGGIPQTQASSISFNGPTSSGNNQPQQQPPQQQQQPSIQPNSAYQNNQFDLSTSNWGNNGGMQTVASYMQPNGNSMNNGQQPQQQPPTDFTSLFNSMNNQFNPNQQPSSAFNSAASQLSPSAVAPPPSSSSSSSSGSMAGNQPSSIFGGASSLFNSQQQPSQQQPTSSGNSLFSNPSYLNSFLTNSAAGAFGNGQGNLFGSDQTLSGIQSLLNPSGSASNQAPSSILPSSGSQPAASSVSSTSSSSPSSKRFGISSFIMPMLALAGLSLLIPTMSNIGTAVGRKKRSIVEDRAQQVSAGQLAKETSIGEYMDRIERYYGIYKNAVENDDCLNRLICEFGDAVKDITGKSAVVTVVEKLVPNWMAGKMHLFKEAALDNKDGKEKCKKYTCHNQSRQH